MSVEDNPRSNPYVGPRAFERGETLFGRTKELRELVRLLVAERILLCHSPSGAGKTSLIQASLIPELDELRQFHVYRLILVNLDVPPDVDLPPATNRYVLSALRCLEADRPAEQQLDLAALAALTFSEYIAQRNRNSAEQNDQVLIFDQFEEIITVDPLNLPAKTRFFEQVGELLRTNEAVWALFAIREEYVASLDPYAEHIPRRLRTTYRLPLLEHKTAIEAMVSPAHNAGVTFTPAAAERLAADLSRVKVQRPDGSTDYQPGPYIEPVQLQVVCYRLWSQLGPGATTIHESDIATQGDVNSALAEFYNQEVAAIAERTEHGEQAIRAWFDHALISPEGVRNQVLQGQSQSAGLDNCVVAELVKVHLVRLERQRGAAWLELAHDRLIEPIQDANRAWREQHLSTLQRQAALWDGENRPDGLLLHGESLAEAEAWAAARPGELSEVERAFLDACREERVRGEREVRDRKRIRFLALAASLLSALLLVAAIGAVGSSRQANAQRQTAEAERQTADVLRQEADNQRSLAETEEANARSALATASTAQNLAETAQRRAEDEAEKAREALDRARTAEGQRDLIANQQAAVRLAADQLSALAGGDPDEALALALGSLTAPVESPQLDLLLSRAADAAGTRAVLPGDTNEVLAVAVRPDGSLTYTGDRSGKVRIWNLADGSPVGEFRAHRSGVQKIVFSPDERWIATASDDRTARIWNADSFGSSADPIHTLGPHDDLVIDVAFSPDSTRLLTGSWDNTVKLWDVASGAELASFPALPAVSFSPDGRSALMVQAVGNPPDFDLVLVNLTTGNVGTRFLGHKRPVQALVLTKDQSKLISASADSTIRLWDLASGEADDIFEGHTATVWSLALSDDGTRLLSSSADNTIRLWDVSTGEELRTYYGHTGSVYSIAFSPNEASFVSGAEDGQGRIWDVAGRQEIAVLEGARDSLQSVAVSPDGTTIIAGGNDGILYRWERASGTQLDPILVGSTAVFGVAYSPDGSLVAVGFEDGSVSVIPADGGPPLWRAQRGDQMANIAFSPDGQYVLTAGKDNRVRLWKAVDGELVSSFTPLGSEATDVAFSADGSFVVASSQDWSVRVWDTASGDELGRFGDHLAGVLSVAVSPDGQTIASGGTDRQIILRDRASGEIKQRLVGHAAAVWSVAFSPDGTQLASGSADRTVRVWDVTTGREIRQYSGHTQRVWSVAFAPAPDGASVSVVSAASDRTVRVWRLESREELIDWVRANRYWPPLTCDQTKLYRLETDCVGPSTP